MNDAASSFFAADSPAAQSPAARLLSLLQNRRAAYALEAHDAISAQVVDEAGFSAIWASSLTLSAARGYRDRNELSMSEALDALETMTRRVRTPVLFDAGNGYGDAQMFALLVEKLGRRGVAGACIEDRDDGKLNSLLDGVTHRLAPVEAMCAKIQAGRHAHPEVVIVARTEAFIAGGAEATIEAVLPEALARAHAYADAGAQAILVHSKAKTVDQVAAFAQAWTRPVPLICVPTTYGWTDRATFETLKIALVIWANHNLRAAVASMQQVARTLMHATNDEGLKGKLVAVSEIFRLSGENEMSTPKAHPRLKCAIVLAAGMGTRLGELGSAPKGLLQVDGESLVERSLRLLIERGMSDIRLVVGYEAHTYEPIAKALPQVTLVRNDDYKTTGTLQSLRCALEGVASEDCLLLESDLFYEPRALDVLLAHPQQDVLLASGFTQARDEVFVQCQANQAGEKHLRGLSKQRDSLASHEVVGEMVGICKLSQATLEALKRSAHANDASYETDGLASLCLTTPIAVHVEPKLLWGEVDDLQHLRRVREEIAPLVSRLKP